MYAAIVALETADRAPIEAHLLRLAAEDRSLRFAAGLVTDATVRRYVASLDFARDLVVGLVSKRGHVIALAHGCPFEARGRAFVEAAFSVDAEWRGHGFGKRLLEALLLRTAAAGGATVIGRCALRNLAMRRVFEHGGMTLTREDDEMEARCELPPLCCPCDGVASGTLS